MTAAIARRRGEAVLRVAVSGIDGAGKSTFGDELADALRRHDVPVIRSTTDSFHNPRSVRWARGKLSPEGFYRDSHDLAQLKTLLLDPLSARPPQAYRVAAFDEPTNSPVDAPLETSPPGAVLVFDGLFLHREELRGYWDFSIWIDGERRVTDERIRRARDAIPAGLEGVIELVRWCAVLRRHVQGMQMYIDECSPMRLADAVIDNNDFLAPLLKWQAQTG